MSFVLAVGGKGGVGKTTISGLMIRYLLKTGKKPILAIDADANATLNEILGVNVPQTIGSLREDVLKEIKNLPMGVFKETYLEYKLQNALIEEKGFDLLVMGRPEGPKCYCYANDVLRKYIDVIAQNYPYLIMDNEAGMEHLSRRTTQNIDIFFIISTPTLQGIKTANRIKKLINELNLNIKKLYLVINRVENDISAQLKEEIDKTGLELIYQIPACSQLQEYEINGKTIFDLPDDNQAVLALNKMLEKLGV